MLEKEHWLKENHVSYMQGRPSPLRQWCILCNSLPS